MKREKLQEYLTYRKRLSVGGAELPHHLNVKSVSVAELYDAMATAAKAHDTTPHYMNHGLWSPTTTTLESASNSLMEKLVHGMCGGAPQNTPAVGTVLDVACGLGATTRYLCRFWDPGNLYGINISENQLAVCRQTAPACHFSCMDATRLGFPAAFFDHVVCVEAAFQFNTRRAFFDEAYRVLKPGGVLAMTDVIAVPDGHTADHKYVEHHPPQNYVASSSAYREQLSAAGFTTCDLTDITEQGSRSYFRFSVAVLHHAWLTDMITFEELHARLDSLYLIESLLGAEFLCFARK